LDAGEGSWRGRSKATGAKLMAEGALSVALA
jgi:hypothetical protein